ncbi:TonB-dependent receptor [Methylophilus aquaticus]|uniref:TonB-dependent receptor n=1 Tax=Methylophilus aquaticus TaxID=1971610 RepID=A0ABT9JQD4_9PROT|nr:TonB-dependent receptor [Methylophilus aquaticus]MDP8566694.1 TonB-dependent receptor [Methylophilus aquaticus]
MKCTPQKLSFAVLYAICLNQAVAAESKTNDAQVDTLDEVKVNASADANAKGLMKPYAGGQVAKGGRVGVMGNQDAMDTPFSINAYTNALIQNQQARSVGDVLLNDPSVRVARGFGNFQESYFIRGYILNSDSVAYNGLYGLLPRQYISAELFERVEVLRGASAFLNGASPNGDGIGGSISLLPKRAPNDPLNLVTTGWSSGNQQFVSADIARRFGPDDSAGLRLNVSKRKGGTAVDREHVELDLISLGFDWRGENIRVSADAGYQDNKLNETRTNVTLSASSPAITGVPSAPASDKNWAQPWSYSNERDVFGTLRAEWDVSAQLTAYAAAGARHTKEANSLANLTLSNSSTGAGTMSRFDNIRDESVITGEAGLKGTFNTASIEHDWVLSTSAYSAVRKIDFAFQHSLNTNLYTPVYYAQPAFTGANAAPFDLYVNYEANLQSVALGDTLSLFDKRLLLTLGARQQNLKYINKNATGATTSQYDESKLSPALGMVVKPWQGISLYANYIEALSQGDTAPATANGSPVVNAGQVLAPFVSKQKEVGAKFDFGKVRLTTAYFTTEKPRGVTNTSNIFKQEGSEDHQGVELMTYGEVMAGLRLLGGVTWLDTKQKNTNNAATEGKRTIGVPDKQANLGVEWDVRGASGLTLDARVIVTDSVYANAANTLEVPGWTRLDIGARYVTDIKGKLVTVRGRVDNVTDRDYWASSGGFPNNGYLVLGAPRMVTVSAQLDF